MLFCCARTTREDYYFLETREREELSQRDKYTYVSREREKSSLRETSIRTSATRERRALSERQVYVRQLFFDSSSIVKEIIEFEEVRHLHPIPCN